MSSKVEQLLQAQNMGTKKLYQYRLYHLQYVQWFNDHYNNTNSETTTPHSLAAEKIDYSKIKIDAYKVCLFMIHVITEAKDKSLAFISLQKIVPSLKLLYNMITVFSETSETGSKDGVLMEIPNYHVVESFLSYVKVPLSNSTTNSKNSMLDKICVNFYNDNTEKLNAMKSSIFRNSLEKLKFLIDFNIQYYGNVKFEHRELIKLNHLEIVPSGPNKDVFNVLVKFPVDKSTDKMFILPSMPTNMFACPVSCLSVYLFLRVYGSNNYAGDLLKHYDPALRSSTTTENKAIKPKIDYPLIKGRFIDKSISHDTMSHYYQCAFQYLTEPYKKNYFFNKKLDKPSSPKTIDTINNTSSLNSTFFWNISAFEVDDKTTPNKDFDTVLGFLFDFLGNDKDKKRNAFMMKQWKSLPEDLYEPIFKEFKVKLQNPNEREFWEVISKKLLMFLPVIHKFFPYFDVFKAENNFLVSDEYLAFYQKTCKQYQKDEHGSKIWDKYLNQMNNLVEKPPRIANLSGDPGAIQGSDFMPERMKQMVKAMVEQQLAEHNLKRVSSDSEQEEEEDDEEEEEEQEDQEELQQMIKSLIQKEFSLLKSELMSELRTGLAVELKRDILKDLRSSTEGVLNSNTETSNGHTNIQPSTKKNIDAPESPLEPLRKKPALTPASSKPAQQDLEVVENFTLDTNEQLPIANIVCEWYSPDPSKGNLSIHIMNKKHDKLWREQEPNKSLYRLRKPIIEAYLKTLAALNKQKESLRKNGAAADSDTKIETVNVLNRYCESKFDNDIAKMSTHLRNYLKVWKTHNSDGNLEWLQ